MTSTRHHIRTELTVLGTEPGGVPVIQRRDGTPLKLYTAVRELLAEVAVERGEAVTLISCESRPGRPLVDVELCLGGCCLGEAGTLTAMPDLLAVEMHANHENNYWSDYWAGSLVHLPGEHTVVISRGTDLVAAWVEVVRGAQRPGSRP